MIKEQIIDLIKKVVIDLGISGKDIPAFTLEHPDDFAYYLMVDMEEESDYSVMSDSYKNYYCNVRCLR